MVQKPCPFMAFKFSLESRSSGKSACYTKLTQVFVSSNADPNLANNFLQSSFLLLKNSNPLFVQSLPKKAFWKMF